MTLKRRIAHAERFAALSDDLCHLSEAELDARIVQSLRKLSEAIGGPTPDEWTELLQHASQLGWTDAKVAAAKQMVGV